MSYRIHFKHTQTQREIERRAFVNEMQITLEFHENKLLN